MGASDYLEEKILDHVFNLNSFVQPSNLYVALFTAAPSDSGGGTEVSGNAYARVEVTNNSSSWTRTNSTVVNDNAITFPTPTPSGWGTVTHYGIYDASSGGNLIDWNVLTNARVTQAGTPLEFAAGALVFTAS